MNPWWLTPFFKAKVDFLSSQKPLAASLQVLIDIFFFVISKAASTRSLAKILTDLLLTGGKCYVAIRRQWEFKFFQNEWLKDRMVAVVKN